MAKRTVGDVIKRSRDILQDTVSEEYRYTDDSLVGIFNDSIAEIKRLRPDAFIYGEDLPSFTASEFASDFPLAEIFFQPAVYFIAGQAELRDDEFTVENRAMTLLSQFSNMLVR